MFENLQDPLKVLLRDLKRLERITQLELSIIIGKRRDVIDLTSSILERMKKNLDLLQRHAATLKPRLLTHMAEKEVDKFLWQIRLIVETYMLNIADFEQNKNDLKEWLAKSELAMVQEYLRELFNKLESDIETSEKLAQQILALEARTKLQVVAEIYVHGEYLDELAKRGPGVEARAQQAIGVLIDALKSHNWNPSTTVIDFSHRSYNNFYMEHLKSSGLFTISLDQQNRLYWFLEGMAPRRLYLCDIWGVSAPKNHMKFNRTISHYQLSSSWSTLRRVAA